MEIALLGDYDEKRGRTEERPCPRPREYRTDCSPPLNRHKAIAEKDKIALDNHLVLRLYMGQKGTTV